MSGDNFLRDTKVIILSEVWHVSQALEETLFFNTEVKLFYDVLRISSKTENLDEGGHCNGVDHFRTLFYPGLLPFNSSLSSLSSDAPNY